MNGSLIQQLAVAVAEEQERFKARINQIIEGALGLSETEIMAAAQNLTSINHEARQHVGDLRTLQDRTGGEREIAAEVILHQSRYCQDAVALLRQQSDVAERSQHLSREIASFAESIGRISDSARILTINGQIESVRMGTAGAAFAVIANQMRDLSHDVQKANRSIADLAHRLGEYMPMITQNAQALLGMTEAFSQQQFVQVSRFQTASDQTQKTMHQALSESQERVERLLTGSGEILTHLQFQDRMAQDLRSLEDMVGHNAAILTEFLQRLGSKVEAGEPGGMDPRQAVQEALSAARENAPRPCRRMGDLASDPRVELTAGEVMFF